ncbi:hypothetical protein NLI96_g10923 [Meripilus lineatus]|uniref:Uncharacterized protein n=1 Tax=Meripilus lineatus TaxID=2056292 RepID=A0AAD5YBH0_9APHY|nr:hypothetical protein NLI96_g10923 [Physisporinus lineatus]
MEFTNPRRNKRSRSSGPEIEGLVVRIESPTKRRRAAHLRPGCLRDYLTEVPLDILFDCASHGHRDGVPSSWGTQPGPGGWIRPSAPGNLQPWSQTQRVGGVTSSPSQTQL